MAGKPRIDKKIAASVVVPVMMSSRILPAAMQTKKARQRVSHKSDSLCIF